MVTVKRIWQTTQFTASKKGMKPVTIEVSINFETKKYTICTAQEESVSFKEDTIEVSKLKLQALKQAINYIENCIT